MKPALVLCALSLAACGPASLDPAGFARAADLMCEDLRVRSARIAEPDPLKAWEELIRLNEATADNIEGLRSPPEVEDELRALLVEIRDGIAALRLAARAIREDDEPGRRAAETRFRSTAARRTKLARALGMKSCGAPPATPSPSP